MNLFHLLKNEDSPQISQITQICLNAKDQFLLLKLLYAILILWKSVAK